MSRAKAQLRDDRPRFTVTRETHHHLQSFAQLFFAATLRYKSELRITLAVLNGQWAWLRFIGGGLESAHTFESDGDRIVRIYVQRNPDKLRRIAAAYNAR